MEICDGADLPDELAARFLGPIIVAQVHVDPLADLAAGAQPAMRAGDALA
ncbi:hypothetical protein SAMN05518849_1475 [Sphingobium sp. AP50]|nr:hypothetical protein SAMN05518849_1475 [Sphingobium sp. AP50]